MKNTAPSIETLFEYIRGEASVQHRSEVESWMNESDENETTLSELAKLYYACRGLERMRRRDTDAAYDTVMRSIRRRRRTIRLSWAKIAAAATLLVAVDIGIWFATRQTSSDTYITLRSNAEKKVEYSLPDGTTVFLNRNSSLRFPVRYAEKFRCVTLDGEAYFEVTRDPERPFIVTTQNNISVRVLGTKFDVEAYASDSIARVFLLDGRVDVRVGDEYSERSFILSPREELCFNSGSGQVLLRENESVTGTEWMDNTFVFRNTPFPEVVRQLSHNFGVDFEIRDPELNAYTFTGTFDNRYLTQILQYMRISSGIGIACDASDPDRHRFVLTKK